MTEPVVRSHTATSEADTIATALRDGPSGELGQRLAAARAAWPGDLRLQLLEGEWHEKGARPSAAEACYRAAGANHPANPWPWARLAGLFLTQQRSDAARELFSDSIWASSLPEATRIGLLSRIVGATIDPAQRTDFLNGLLSGTADDRFVLLKLAALHFRQRDRATAARLFEAASLHGTLPVESQLLALELKLAAGRFDEAYELALSLHRQYPDRVDFARRAVQAAHFANKAASLAELLEGAIARWPGDWLLLFRYNRAACPMALDHAVFARLEDEASRMATDPRWTFQFVVAALRHGRTPLAMSLVAQLSQDDAVRAMAAPLNAALATRSATAWHAARGVTNDAAIDVQIVRRPGARATVVVIPGVQAGLGYLPFSHVDALLADHAVNAVYLRDVTNRAFVSGVKSLAQDVAGSDAGLRAIFADLGGVPVVAMGASLGGMVAVRMATRLGCHAAISYAGPVHLGTAAPDTEEPGRGPGVRSSMASSMLNDDYSLPEMVRAATTVRVYQCYGPGYAPDAAEADLLRGCPNAVLVEVPECRDHFVVEHMIASGAFGAVLERAIDAPPP